MCGGRQASAPSPSRCSPWRSLTNLERTQSCWPSWGWRRLRRLCLLLVVEATPPYPQHDPTSSERYCRCVPASCSTPPSLTPLWQSERCSQMLLRRPWLRLQAVARVPLPTVWHSHSPGTGVVGIARGRTGSGPVYSSARSLPVGMPHPPSAETLSWSCSYPCAKTHLDTYGREQHTSYPYWLFAWSQLTYGGRWLQRSWSFYLMKNPQ